MPSATDVRPPLLVALEDFLTSLSDHRPLGVAVSGGSDSLGLLTGLARLAPPVRLVALTVDHGLRPRSAEEARIVKCFSRQIGIRHETLRWQGDKPSTGIQAGARRARYRLLGEAAQRLGLGAVLTGHTLDDQRETLAMRHARFPDEDSPGLTGIPAASLFDGRMWVLRPLLGMSRAEIRDFLLASGANWLEDPSNFDDRFERVRVRGSLKEDTSATPFSLEPAERMAMSRIVAAVDAAAFVDRACTLGEDGIIRVLLDGANGKKHELLALETLIAWSGGAVRPLDRRGKVALRTFLERCRPGSALTVGRTLLRFERGILSLRRERRRLEALRVPPGRTEGWDGRYRITNLDRNSDLIVSPDAGPAALPFFSRDSGAPSNLFGPLDGVEGGFVVTRLSGRFSRVLPVYELPLAQALTRLAGERAFPACPWSVQGGWR
ncbi:tRNA lysidine(34) synthetase TilS [Hoeflea sp.]|uniref:tRNA lysidine(34) synthetase TilS n=1 Tax=Hoeflea sp. TaxID=1940281 RepID=UPI003BAE6BD9